MWNATDVDQGILVQAPKAGMEDTTAMLGDKLAQMLGTLGITEERVSRWLGRPCGCKERQAKLNALGGWLRQALTGRQTTEQATQHLKNLIDEEE